VLDTCENSSCGENDIGCDKDLDTIAKSGDMGIVAKMDSFCLEMLTFLTS
jgi:hypothetical protein